LPLCEYGCGQEATYQLKNSKWCCSEKWQKCPGFKKKISTIVSGENNPNYGKKHSSEIKEKIRVKAIGRIPWNKGIERSLKIKNILSEKLKGREPWNKGIFAYSCRRTIEKIKVKYPFFSKVEEMRYNPDKPNQKEIQVHCKNHDCINSKEQDGWFTPTTRQIEARISALENSGRDLCCFYCSDKCKQECPLYNSHGIDPFKKVEKPYTQEEYHIWKNLVLEQDNYECQKCGSKENLHCHHIIPVKLKPLFALDPDNGIVLCKTCHYKYGHKLGSECSTINLANKVCI